MVRLYSSAIGILNICILDNSIANLEHQKDLQVQNHHLTDGILVESWHCKGEEVHLSAGKVPDHLGIHCSVEPKQEAAL